MNYRESLQEAIDVEIKSLEESLRALKLRRNALQPISSLPSEIFAAIFSASCLPRIPSSGGKPARTRTRLRISHVCHQWREIALNQPLLWSHINFDTVSSAGATEILARAKSVPLYMETRDARFGLFLEEVQARLPHIRYLSIGSEYFEALYHELATLVSPAPTLEYLSLCCQENENMRYTLIIRDLDGLFGGSTPRLSYLKLRNCNINWNSPLFKGLKYLKIVTPNKTTRPTLAVWLDALDEIPQLKTLTLHSASPVAVHFPFDVERTVTLPSLTHLDILASFPDCALALAHLILPALTSLCLAEVDHYPRNSGRVQEFLPYVVRHFHGPQDIRPLQSVLIHNRGYVNNLYLLAWSVPDIDTLVHDPPAILGATLPTRVKLCLRGTDDDRLEVLKMVMAALPLHGLSTLVAVDLYVDQRAGDRGHSQFWLDLLPNWPLLRRMRLAPKMLSGFILALLEDCTNLLLPSLTELALAETTLNADWTSCLLDVLMKRVEQGIPLETLDLRMCHMVASNP